MKIADYAIKHPAVILMCLIIFIFFGAMAGLSLNRNLIANINLPTVLVVTTWPGVGAEDIEKEITNPLEESLGTMEGLKQISSRSQNSVSMISLELGYNEDINSKLPDIREKINNAMEDLPDDLPSPPEIFPYSTSQLPIMTILMEGQGSRAELSRLCSDEVIPALSRIDGVAAVNVFGDSRDVVEISVNMDKLQGLGLSVLDIAQRVRAFNSSLPGGEGVYQGYSLNLRTEGRYGSIQEIEDQVLAYRDGQYIHLKDLADIGIREEAPDTYVISGGEESLVLFIAKQNEGDSVYISAEARKALENISRKYADGVSFIYLKDDSNNIQSSMNSVFQSAAFGAALAVLILFVFLHNRNTTLIIGFSIPLSILFTLIGLWVRGSTLDLITLGGLTSAIGMVVDASIVVLENIQRHFNSGMSRKEAASVGVAEVGGAVAASTVTSLAAFIPLLFLQGLTGFILRDVAWTIIFALFSSMFVAFIVVPFLCSQFLKPEKPHSLGSRLAPPSEKFMDGLSSFYEKTLRGALNSKASFLAGIGLFLLLSFLSIRLLGFEFIAQTDMAEIQIGIETPGGYSLEMTREKVIQFEKELRGMLPELEASYFVVGLTDIFGAGREKNRAYGTIKLTETGTRKRHVTQILSELREEMPQRIPDIRGVFENGGISNLLSLATGGSGLIIGVYGDSMDAVLAGAEQVREYMRRDPNVADTDLDVRFDQREMTANLLHQYLGTLGLSAEEISMMNRVIFNGVSLGLYYGGTEHIPIELRTNITGGRISSDILYGLQLNSSQGTPVSLANVAELETAETVSQILHRNKVRSVTASAGLINPNVRETTRRVTALINTQGLVPGVNWELRGTTEEMLSSFRSLLAALGIAVFLVYAVMVIQFERFSQPLLIMSAIPFSMIGITFGLLVFGSSLNLVSILGIITLAGVVVNNAIVLIDYINLLRDKYHKPLEEAIIEGARSRLKPILMTTLTTLLGVFPLAVGMGEGSEIYSPLGQSILGGLFSSTFITLFFIPLVYHILESRKEKTKAAVRSKETPQ